MDEIILSEKMSSVEIAELTGKNHSHLLRDIRKMEGAWEKVNQTKFGSIDSYKDSKGREQTCYMFDKTECLYIATRFNDEARAKLILRWKELEEKERAKHTFAIPQSFSEALMLAAKQQEKIEEQQKLIDAKDSQIHNLINDVNSMQEKVSYVDKILNNPSTRLITSIAQDYGMSAKKFNKKLKELNIQHKIGKQWVLNAKYITCARRCI